MQQVTFSCPVSDDGKEMIEQLKEKFEKAEEKNAKLQVLTILPKSWSIPKFKKNLEQQLIWHRRPKSLYKKKVFCLCLI